MFHNHTKARILSLSIEEAPMMETQFHRPLVAGYVDDVLLGNIAANIQANNGEVNTSMLSNVISGIALPSAAPEMVNNQLMPANVAGGWMSQRLKFIMRVAVDIGFSQEAIECYVGYTDRKDVTMQSNQLADDVLFVINNGWVEQTVRSVNGMGDRTVMRNTANIISNAGYENLFSNDPSRTITKIRPIDAFTMMSNAPAMESGVVDATNIGIVSKNPTPSSTDNNVISSYLNNVITGYVNGLAQVAAGEDMPDEPGFGGVSKPRNNLYTIAASYVPEIGLPTALRFTMMLGMNRHGSPVGSETFTMKELRSIDPTIAMPGKISYYKNNHTFASQLMIPQDGFNNWAGASPVEQVAAQMSNIIPSLMFRYGINSVGGRATNRTITQQTDVSTSRLILTAGDMLTTQQFTERFKKDLLTEGIIPVTLVGNYQRDFDIQFSATLGNELEMVISLDGGDYIPYRAPMFCNSITAPVFGRDTKAANLFATTLESIIQQSVLPVHRLTANLGINRGGPLSYAGLAPMQVVTNSGYDIGSGPAPHVADLNNQPY